MVESLPTAWWQSNWDIPVNHEKTIGKQRLRRKRRVRKRTRGVPGRPRLTVFRSHKHIYAQLIDDQEGRTLASASTQDKEIRASVTTGGNKDAAGEVGKSIAERGIAAGVKQVAFDRREYQYHGRVAALADAARKAGLEFWAPLQFWTPLSFWTLPSDFINTNQKQRDKPAWSRVSPNQTSPT